jgi:excisionase family DNA binding protein
VSQDFVIRRGMTVREAARELRLSEGYVRNMVQRHLLEIVPLDGRTYLIPAEAVETYKRERRQAGRPRKYQRMAAWALATSSGIYIMVVAEVALLAAVGCC